MSFTGRRDYLCFTAVINAGYSDVVARRGSMPAGPKEEGGGLARYLQVFSLCLVPYNSGALFRTGVIYLIVWSGSSGCALLMSFLWSVWVELRRW